MLSWLKVKNLPANTLQASDDSTHHRFNPKQQRRFVRVAFDRSPNVLRWQRFCGRILRTMGRKGPRFVELARRFTYAEDDQSARVMQELGAQATLRKATQPIRRKRRDDGLATFLRNQAA